MRRVKQLRPSSNVLPVAECVSSTYLIGLRWGGLREVLSMRSHTRRFSHVVTVLRAAGALAVAGLVSSCHTLDTTRQAPPKATLGDDVYGVFCDRVGASVLSEDLSGASYEAVCHYDAQGKYGDTIDVSGLPEPRLAKLKAARDLSLAKMAAMARHRSELIRAVNAIFPDSEIADPTGSADAKIKLHDALLDFTQKLVPLYESNPFDKAGAPLFPTSTRSLARLLGGLGESDEARQALTRMWGRRGYRPFQVALGAIRPALAYPGLRPMTRAALGVLGPNGSAAPELQQLLKVGKQELLTSRPVVAPLPPLTVDAATLQPSRPRSAIEFASSFLLSENDAFAESATDPHRYIVLRDRRGFAATTLQAPFVDQDMDGLADVDGFGRFVGASGQPLGIELPFALAGSTATDIDAYGRPQSSIPLFQYLDTSRTLAGAVGRHLVPLVDATMISSGEDAWKNEHETLMYALAGSRLLFGDREDAQYDYKAETIQAKGASCASCVPYQRFKGEESPLPDLLHAAGQLLADEDSDGILESLADLMENHEDVVARLLGAALQIREIANQHDKLAAQGQEATAEMPYATPIWDEMAQLLGDLTAKHPGLLAKLMEALASDVTVSQQGTSKHLGETVASFMENRDEISYNPLDLNGPALNLTDGAPSIADPHNAVDQTKPKVDKNRSCMQRSFQLIHDADGGPACNREGAKVKASLLGGTVSWPLIGSYKECELFRFDRLAIFYLDSMLDPNHPKRSFLDIKSGTLNGIINFLGNVGASPDQLFEDSSGITGLTLHPSSAALSRLMLFGASQSLYPSMPDLDTINAGKKTDNFISNLIDPVSKASCPLDSAGVLQCKTHEGSLRVADKNSIFLWERLGFYNYLRPVVTAFASDSCAPDLSSCDKTDVSGEQLFVDIVNVLNRHWPGKDHGKECSKSGTAQSNKEYCSEAGVNSYEPILAEAFRTDLIPALHDFAKVVSSVSKITIKRGPKAGQTLEGAALIEKMTRILFDPAYAKGVGMVDRKGNAGTTWVDGTAQPQLTVFNLFTDAFHRMDLRWAEACKGLSGQEQTACAADADLRKGQWKRARSQLVDEFLAVEGSGPSARFHNRATAHTLTSLLRVTREQLNANCPERENGQACQWAKKELGDKLATTLSGPLFAALMDVQEKLRADEPSRRSVEKMLAYFLASASKDDALQSTLASLTDIVQLLGDDGNFSPIFNAAASASNPEGDKDGPGVADTTIKVLKALTGDDYDRYHVLDTVLPALVTPMDGGKGASPIEVFMDTIADVNRLDAAKSDALDTEDYKAIFGTVHDFMTSENRGLEQFYTIMAKRPRGQTE